MRDTILAAALFLTLAQIGQATPWDIETAPGQWSHNPDCTGQCAIDRSDAMQGHKPKPGKPEIVEEGGKGPRQMLQADKRDREPTFTTAKGYYCRLNGEVVNFRNAPGLPPKRVTRACPSYAHKVVKSGGVPGPFGPHEGGK